MTSQSNLQALENDLHAAANEIKKRPIMALFDAQSSRAQQFSTQAPAIHLDYSKQAIDQNSLSLLIALAKEKQLSQKRDAMFRGDAINHTEQRAVLHTALRNTQYVDDAAIATDINRTKTRFLEFVDEVHNHTRLSLSGKPFTDVISIGIGGSFFGPKMLESALVSHHSSPINVHYLANIDGVQLDKLFNTLNPDTTLVIVASKSWTTAETQLNANAVKAWFLAQLPETAIAKQWVALTTKPEKAAKSGINHDLIFPMWDFIGGRYSVWSAIGLALALKIGSDNFNALLAGASDMDNHFISAPFESNVPVLMALISYWQQCYFDHNNLMVLPYSHALKALPAYLQQLDMESNGKSVNQQGESVAHSGAILWGAEGTNCQHSFMQLLHQGKQKAMVDFILPKTAHPDFPEHHNNIVANCLAQAQALLQGKSCAQAEQELIAQGMTELDARTLAKHKQMPGNQGSNTLLLDDTSPYTLGALLALYEHKVFSLGVLFDVNSFDQWGVELGKQLGKGVLNALQTGNMEALDPSTQHLLAQIYN